MHFAYKLHHKLIYLRKLAKQVYLWYHLLYTSTYQNFI